MSQDAVRTHTHTHTGVVVYSYRVRGQRGSTTLLLNLCVCAHLEMSSKWQTGMCQDFRTTAGVPSEISCTYSIPFGMIRTSPPAVLRLIAAPAQALGKDLQDSGIHGA